MIRIVNWLFGAAILGGLAWSGWWYALSQDQEAALDAWFADRQRAGWQAERETIGLTGFPLRLEREITNIRLADPKTGWAWASPWLRIESAAFNPTRFDVTWPDEQALAVPGERTRIASETMTAALELKPRTDLGLVQARVDLDRLDVKAQSGWQAKAGAVTADVTERVNDDGYEIDFRAEKVLLPQPLMRRIDPTGLAGREVERMTFVGAAAFDAPLDRHLIEDGRLALRELSIRQAGFQWGRLRLLAEGKLKVDKRGYPVGKVALTMRHWRDIVELARRSGMIERDLAEGLVTALEVVALLGGNKNELDVTLTFEDTKIWIGPVSVGAAPRVAPPQG